MSGADTVFVGGHVLLDGTSRRGGIAVRDGRISLVGSDDDVRAMVGAPTEVVDVMGGLVTPGFQDAHAHPLAAGVDPLALRPQRLCVAYVNDLDDVTGRLEVGQLADVAVLDRDSFACPADEIASTRVVAT